MHKRLGAVPNLVGPRSPDNFMGPSSSEKFMGRFVGPTALIGAVILTFNRCSATAIRNRIYYRYKILEAGPKGKNKYKTPNFRHEAGVLYNLFYERKTKFRYRKHGRRNDFGRNSLISLDLSHISNDTKKLKSKQPMYRPEQVLRVLGG